MSQPASALPATGVANIGIPKRAGGPAWLVRTLAAVTFLQWLAASLVLPLLPADLHRRGASDLVIGLAMAAFFVGALVVQYPVGRLSDRIPPRVLLLVAALGYAVASAGFLFPAPPGAAIGIRAAQGAAAGAAEVVALAIIGRSVLPARRTRAYAAIFGAQMAGLAIGPLLAGAVGGAHMSALFLLATGTAFVSCLPLLRGRWSVPAGGERAPERASAPTTSRVSLRAVGALRPVFAAAAITGLTTGVYEACWTLLLDDRGASSWQIGLSWSLFCIPFVAISALAGRLGDRLDPRWIQFAALACSVVLVMVYPFLTSIPTVIALGAVEGVATALAYPAAQTLLARHAPPGELGRAQGGFATVQTAAIAIAAAAGGVLFAAGPWLPFVVVGVACAALLCCQLPRGPGPFSDGGAAGRSDRARPAAGSHG